MAMSSSPPLPSPPLHDDQSADSHHLPPSLSNPNYPKSTPLMIDSPPKKIAPLPWTHQETINLIQAYQEKWYSLKRGQLKANQWEEIAITVAARCGYDEPSKSATQCRHKIEKLRKRYRSEKLKSYPNSWLYFDLLDRMERGPLPISARPMVMVNYQNSNSINDDDSEDEEADLEYCKDIKKNKSRSINHIVRGDTNKNWAKFEGGGGGGDRVLPNDPFFHKRKEYSESGDEDEEEEEEERQEGARGSEIAGELATEIRAFAQRFVKMENKKIEMMKETERFRMEMENKRVEMILESQRKIVDTIHRAFGCHK